MPETSQAQPRLSKTLLNYFPEGCRNAFKSRLKQDKGGAFLELCVNKLCIEAGYSVSYEPQIEGQKHRPDFAIKNGAQIQYIECVTVTRRSDEADRDIRNSLKKQGIAVHLSEIRELGPKQICRNLSEKVKEHNVIKDDLIIALGLSFGAAVEQDALAALYGAEAVSIIIGRSRSQEDYHGGFYATPEHKHIRVLSFLNLNETEPSSCSVTLYHSPGGEVREFAPGISYARCNQVVKNLLSFESVLIR